MELDLVMVSSIIRTDFAIKENLEMELDMGMEY